MKMTHLLMILLVTSALLLGCITTATDSTKTKGTRIGSGPVGPVAVTSTTLSADAVTLGTIELSLKQQLSKNFETHYEELEETRYRTAQPGGGAIAIGVGGVVMSVGALFLGDNDAGLYVGA